MMRFTQRKIAILGTSIVGAGFCYSQLRKLENEKLNNLNLINTNGSQPMIVIDHDMKKYPWERNPLHLEASDKNWEFQKIKVKGTLLPNTHYIYKEKGNKPGFLVFKPLVTNFINPVLTQLSNTNENSFSFKGFMVSFGWIPADLVHTKKDLEINYIEKVSEDSELPYLFAEIRDGASGNVYNAQTDDSINNVYEGLSHEEVWITGYLRKGETKDALLGRKYWNEENSSTVIDLERMIAVYSFNNVDSARSYYLEAATNKNLEKVNKENDVQPSSLEQPKLTLLEYDNNRIRNFWNSSKNFMLGSSILAFLFA